MKKHFRKILAGVLAIATLCIATPINDISTNPFAINSTYTASAVSNERLTYGDLTYKIVDGEVYILDCSETATEVVIPSEIDGLPVTRIGDSTFYNCSGLTSIIIPNSVTYIGVLAFDYCTRLTSIIIDKDNQYYSDIDGVLFNKDRTTIIAYPIGKTSMEYEIPDSVTGIGDWAFYSCPNLTTVTIPDSVTSIGDGVFKFCSNLTTITIPNSVTSIGYSAFYYCSSLTSITIPDSVTSIGNWAFKWCENLTSIIVHENNQYYSDIDGVLFDKDETTLIQYPIGITSKKYEIPNSVTSIGNSAFYWSLNLNEIIIPDLITSIEEEAFGGCSSLTLIIIPDSVTSIGDWAFYRCINLQSIIIPDSITSIGACVLYDCSSLTSVTIPDSVTVVGEGAFYRCSSLTSITIPASVISIDDYAFDNDYLKTIYGYKGSTAETYANENGITFIPLDVEFAIGDLNGDGVVNSADIIILKQATYGSQKLSPNQAIAGDINSDGKIDVYDLALLKRNIIQ